MTSALDELAAARAHLRAMVSDCNGGDILVRACPLRVPQAQEAACAEPIAPCSVVEALRATNAAIAALDPAKLPR